MYYTFLAVWSLEGDETRKRRERKGEGWGGGGSCLRSIAHRGCPGRTVYTAITCSVQHKKPVPMPQEPAMSSARTSAPVPDD